MAPANAAPTASVRPVLARRLVGLGVAVAIGAVPSQAPAAAAAACWLAGWGWLGLAASGLSIM
eukprot:COSAG02_NODE_65074_length_259_cov_0.593750_1_plen_62_part_10